jgi:AbrB family looped-hinge helix DNA binding protein
VSVGPASEPKTYSDRAPRFPSGSSFAISTPLTRQKNTENWPQGFAPLEVPLALTLQNGKNDYYKSMNAIVSEKGQVTIPKPIRDDLGLEAGSILAFAEDEGRIIVTKILQENPISAWRGRGILPAGRSVDEYLDLVRGA